MEIKKNNFVIFFEKVNISFFFLRINNLKDEEVAYGIVDLPSDNISYIPLANSFQETKKEKLEKSLEITEKLQINNNPNKPYKAFVFSVLKNKITNYKIDINFNYKPNEGLFNLILIISLGISFALTIVFLLILFIKNKKRKPSLDIIGDNLGSLID